ncbi:hypothetical protein AOQ84DRAFT_371449 [Glonium stellatum]|uniref:Uncharacterized protein n=1 Tax=Glonium stellatum TaxID=574774 RepID=A0A8E2FBS4_9PEZI|nr:hypothetical protein AOQ84DRAFT_371449 [Glonium stellatum]
MAAPEMSQAVSDPVTCLGVVLEVLRVEVSEHSNSEEQAQRLGQLVGDITLVIERLTDDKSTRAARDNALDEIIKAVEILRGAPSPINGQVGEASLSIKRTSTTENSRASDRPSNDKNSSSLVFAIPQLPSRFQNRTGYDGRLQGYAPAKTAPTSITMPNSGTTKKGPPTHKQTKPSGKLAGNTIHLPGPTLSSKASDQSIASQLPGEGDHILSPNDDTESSRSSTSSGSPPTTFAPDGIHRPTSPTASSPGTLRAMSRGPSIAPHQYSPRTIHDPSIGPSASTALGMSPASRTKDQALKLGALMKAIKKPIFASTETPLDTTKNDEYVVAANAKSTEKMKNAPRLLSNNRVDDSPVSKWEKECWRSEWYAAGKPVKIADFARMKRAEMRKGEHEGKGKGRVSIQSTVRLAVNTDNPNTLNNPTKRKHKPPRQEGSGEGADTSSTEAAAAPTTSQKTPSTAKEPANPPSQPVPSTPNRTQPPTPPSPTQKKAP